MIAGGYFEYQGHHPMLMVYGVYEVTIDEEDDLLVARVHTAPFSRIKISYKDEHDFLKDWRWKSEY